MKRRYIWTAVLCCYFAAVLVLCLVRPQQIPALSKVIWGIEADKIVHFLMFLPYPLISYIAFRPSGQRKWSHILVVLVLLALGTGLAMGTEQLQGLSEYRSYELKDFYADTAGMGFTSLIIILHIIFKKNKTDL